MRFCEFCGTIYQEVLNQNWYKPIIDAGLRLDIIDYGASLDKYRVIFTPLMPAFEHDIAERMEKWLNNGGTWIVGPLTDIRNEIGARWSDKGYGSLEKLAGVKLKFHAPDTNSRLTAEWNDGTEFKGNIWYELLEDCPGALAKVTEGYSSVIGCPVLTHRQIGKGQIILLGTIPSYNDMKKIIDMFCPAKQDSSGEVIVCPRYGKNHDGVIIVEYGGKHASYECVDQFRDILSDKIYRGKIDINPYDVLVLERQ